jgi:hypothetical protein
MLPGVSQRSPRVICITETRPAMLTDAGRDRVDALELGRRVGLNGWRNCRYGTYRLPDHPLTEPNTRSGVARLQDQQYGA